MIALHCPMCSRPIGRAEDGSHVEVRCYHRVCAGNPIVTFRVRDGRAECTAMIDRRQRRFVG